MRDETTKLITLVLFLASIFLNFKWNFWTLALKMNKNRWHNQISHDETFQMRYWTSWLDNFEDFWPKTSLSHFEIWIFLWLFKANFTIIAYHCVLWSTSNIYQVRSGSFYYLTHTWFTKFAVTMIAFSNLFLRNVWKMVPNFRRLWSFRHFDLFNFSNWTNFKRFLQFRVYFHKKCLQTEKNLKFVCFYC